MRCPRYLSALLSTFHSGNLKLSKPYHSVIQYPAHFVVSNASLRQIKRVGTVGLPANVRKTSNPITLVDEQPPALLPLVQAGFDPPREGSYFTYTSQGQLVLFNTVKTQQDHLPDTKVRENQAPKATEAIPPIALTRKTCPKDFAMSMVC